MYRIFVESYKNFINSIDNESYRFKIAKPFELIIDIDKYTFEKEKESELYKKLSDLLYFIEDNINVFPRLKAFLWTLESRNIKGKRYNVSTKEELEEQTKLMNSFIKLAYWY